MSDKVSHLFVDLDQTLLVNDSTFTIVKHCIRFHFFELVMELWHTKPQSLNDLKNCFVNFVDLKAIDWQYNNSILAFLHQSKSDSSEIWLVTGSSEKVAEFFFLQNDVFSNYIGSNDFLKLKGKSKAKLLEERFGQSEFAYIGDALKDRHVFALCKDVYAPKKSRTKMKLFLREIDITFL